MLQVGLILLLQQEDLPGLEHVCKHGAELAKAAARVFALGFFTARSSKAHCSAKYSPSYKQN